MQEGRILDVLLEHLLALPEPPRCSLRPENPSRGESVCLMTCASSHECCMTNKTLLFVHTSSRLRHAVVHHGAKPGPAHSHLLLAPVEGLLGGFAGQLVPIKRQRNDTQPGLRLQQIRSDQMRSDQIRLVAPASVRPVPDTCFRQARPRRCSDGDAEARNALH